ncbi:MAG: thiosulfate oxidation carrier protein SoxY [Candidatus Rokuibacteriota bacterium]
MTGQPAPRPPGLSRRRFLEVASAAVGLGAVGLGSRPVRAAVPRRPLRREDPAPDTPFERLHYPLLSLPMVTTNGAKVPITVEMAHPMEPDHSITSIHVVNERDPVPWKGTFHFTPANGQVYVSYQARIDQGVSDVSATADCNRHGRWSSVHSINIPPGGGGCASPAPPPTRTAVAEPRPPRIRIPQLVKHGRIRPDELVDVQLLMRHPSRTGLVARDGTFVQETEPFFLQEMQVVYAGQPVSRFAMSSALSDDPFITFRLRARHEGLLHVLLTNNRGQRFEATHQLRFA